MLCSGEGTNLQALIRAAKGGRLGGQIAAVISDRDDAYALVRAKRAGIPAFWIDPERYESRAAFEQAVIDTLEAHQVRLVCLAGFMRILSPHFVRHYVGRTLNIHPALLPAFPGGHAVRDALAWGAKVTGVTVHIVDEEVDHGPIVLQKAVEIRPTDTEASLIARVHRVEHRLYPEAVRLMLSGKVELRGRAAVTRR